MNIGEDEAGAYMCAWFSKKKKKAQKAAVKTTAAAASATTQPKPESKPAEVPSTATAPGDAAKKAEPEPVGPKPLLSPEAEAALIKLAAALTEGSDEDGEGADPSTTKAQRDTDEALAAATLATQSVMTRAAIVQAASASAAQTAMMMMGGPQQAPYQGAPVQQVQQQAQQPVQPQPVYYILVPSSQGQSQPTLAEVATPQPVYYIMPSAPGGPMPSNQMMPVQMAQGERAPIDETEGADEDEHAYPDNLDDYVPDDVDPIPDMPYQEEEEPSESVEAQGMEGTDEESLDELEDGPPPIEEVALHSEAPKEGGEKSVLKDSAALLRSAGSKVAHVGKDVGGKALHKGKELGSKAAIAGKDAGGKAAPKVSSGGKSAGSKAAEGGKKAAAAGKKYGAKALDLTKKFGGKAVDAGKDVGGKVSDSAKKATKKK